MAALCGLGNMEGLIDKTCVIQDQTVGVYGFVFHRGEARKSFVSFRVDMLFADGEWQQCIVDDQLYLLAPDYDDSIVERTHWETIDRRDNEEEYRKIHQVGSRALYFAKCSDQNETWLPLLQKAYAKAHGDYAAIAGGWTGYDYSFLAPSCSNNSQGGNRRLDGWCDIRDISGRHPGQRRILEERDPESGQGVSIWLFNRPTRRLAGTTPSEDQTTGNN